MKPYRDFFKRALDITISGSALLILAIPLAAVAIWLHFANKGAGAFFFQERPGKNERIFKIYKFKTMTDDCDTEGNLLPDTVRLTQVGKFLRSTSVDELPQLWNVLRGDMSLIGPRPLLVRYLPWYSEEEKHRHDVRPGITGWAQCHGRNDLPWNERLAMDIWYVHNLSFKTDLNIVLTTIRTVLSRESVNIESEGALDSLRKSESAAKDQSIYSES